ncbi:restriction endonuclease subunit S [Prevotella sp. tf2-5]|uniref:restriction endonuclease subunit S n=1 Tax=Prevotella sp. tf2-5 TaxID=1761889 RepID=UPI002100F1EA|nr:restriction endonuclease subunit S [Prevotella sp. tf2-5]
MPFEVPEGWEWTVIEDVTVNRDAERIPLSLAVRKKQQNKVYDYYGAAGVIDKVENYLFDERLLLIGEDGANLLSRSKNNAFFAEGKYWVNNHAHVLDCPSKSVLDYVAFVVNSMSLDDYITGSAQPKLTQDNLNKILIPLPPEKEQHRIIESVNDYFSYISLLEDEIEEMNSFVQKAKSKILDLAIHGKLVPQDPNDEPAIELLKRINPKFTPCDNGHYENVPDSWFKVPLGNICTLNEGEPITDKEYPYIDVKGLRTGNYASKQSGKYVPAGTTLILVDGENSGEVFHTPEEGYQGSTMKVLDINNSMNVQYVLFFVKLYQKALRENKVGSAIPHLNKKMFRELVIPVPPIEEQERIVEAIEQYYRILDDISANL